MNVRILSVVFGAAVFPVFAGTWCIDGLAASGTYVRGSTFRNGAAGTGTGVGRQGGAFCVGKDDSVCYVLDCAAENCAAYQGGAFRNAVVLRTLVKRPSRRSPPAARSRSRRTPPPRISS